MKIVSKKGIAIVAILCLLLSVFSPIESLFAVQAPAETYVFTVATNGATAQDEFVATAGDIDLAAGNYIVTMNFKATAVGIVTAKYNVGFKSGDDSYYSATVTGNKIWNNTVGKPETYDFTVELTTAISDADMAFMLSGKFDGYIKNFVIQNEDKSQVLYTYNFKPEKEVTCSNSARTVSVVADTAAEPIPDYSLYLESQVLQDDEKSEYAVKLNNSVPAGTYTVEMHYFVLAAEGELGLSLAGKSIDAIRPTESLKWVSYTSNNLITDESTDSVVVGAWNNFRGYFDYIVVKDSEGEIVAYVDFEPSTEFSKTSASNAILSSAKVVKAPSDVTATDTDKAYRYDFAAAGASQKAAWISNVNYSANGKKVEVYFDYYLTNASDSELHVMNGSCGHNLLQDSDDSDSHRLVSGYNSFSYVSDSYSASNVFVAGIQISNGQVGTNAVLYVWNVSVKVDGTEISNPMQSADGDDITNTEIAFSDIPFDSFPELDIDVYKLSYATDGVDTTGYKYFATSFTHSSKDGTIIEFSFDYYYASNDYKAAVVNYATGEAINDDATKSSMLLPGYNSFKNTHTTKAVGENDVRHPTIKMNEGETGTLYMWNVKFLINGVEQPLTGNLLDNTSGYLNIEVVGVEDIPFDAGFEPDPEVNDGNLTVPSDNKNYALYLDSTRNNNHGIIALDADDLDIKAGTYTLVADIWVESVSNTATKFNINTGINGNDCDNIGVTNYDGWMLEQEKWWTTYETEITVKEREDNKYLIFCWNGFKGYIDNIRLLNSKGKVVAGSLFDFSAGDTTETISNSGQKINIKTAPKANVIDNTVYAWKLEFDEKIANKYEDHANQQYIWFATSWLTEDVKTLTFEMDYYIEGGSEECHVVNIATGAGYPDDTTGYSNLDYGKNHFKSTIKIDVPKGKENISNHFGIRVPKSEKDTLIYVWNIKVFVDGKEIKSSNNPYGITIYSADTLLNERNPENKDYPAVGQLKRSRVDVSKINIKPAPEPDMSLSMNVDQNPGGKLMLLQKNYMYREEYGTLKYQAFMQYFGEDRNGVVIKPNTTYVFSFEYYADPGDFGTGVNSATIVHNSLYTGWNKYITAPNQSLVWKEESGKYEGGITLPNVGRQHIEYEFTTFKNQTDFLLGVQSGWDGNAYYWDFKLVEKGTTTNLIPNAEFKGAWSSMVTQADTAIGKRFNFWQASIHSADMLGTYEFVPFNEEIANLAEGEVLENAADLDDSPIEPIIKEKQSEAESDVGNNSNILLIVLISVGALLIVGTVTLIILKKKGILFKK